TVSSSREHCSHRSRKWAQPPPVEPSLGYSLLSPPTAGAAIKQNHSSSGRSGERPFCRRRGTTCYLFSTAPLE
ncbi:hypothetical protein KUCAC02_000751, partial [Chaenocephalus aceratus]